MAILCARNAREAKWLFSFFFFFGFSRQGFCVALEPVLELALVDQAGLDLTEIRLPLPPKYWD